MQDLKVKVGDMVFVLDMGPAEVIRVTPDGGFEVQVPGRGKFYFQKEGTSGGGSKQRVFYYDPVFITPPKDLVLWNQFVETAKQLYDAMATLKGAGC